MQTMMLKPASLRARVSSAAPVRPQTVRGVAVIRRFQEEGKAGTRSIVDLTKEDHKQVSSLYAQYKSSSSTEKKQQLAWTIIRELSVHSAAEEETIYPEVAKRLGNDAAEHLRGDAGHQKIKHLLGQLNLMDIERDGVDKYSAKLDEAMQAVVKHVAEEENEFWPKFEKAVDREMLMTLGRKFEDAKKHEPTRPHPAAPNKPPLNTPGNAATAPLDKLQDKLQGRQ